MHKVEPVQNQIQSLKSDIKQLQTDAVKPLPQCLAEAAVHTENFITSVPCSLHCSILTLLLNHLGTVYIHFDKLHGH